MALALLSSSISLKRKCEDDEFLRKKIKIVLETETETDSDSEKSESCYSFQNADTATAHDTSDTGTDTDEYEVNSLSEVTLSELSSGPEDCVLIGNLSSLVDEFGSEVSYVADLSDTYSSDDNVQMLSHKKCEKCKGVCEEPFSLCLKCFKQRRIYLPPRPKGKRRKNRELSPRRAGSSLGPTSDYLSGRSSELGSQGSLGSEGSVQEAGGSSQEIAQSSQESAQGSSQDPKSLCKCCFASPVDGVFIHRDSVHPMYCYKCSMKQWKMKGRCPFCNQRCSVAKIFPVED